MLSACELDFNFIEFTNTARFELVIGEGYEENRRIGTRIVNSVRNSNLAERIEQKLPSLDLQAVREQVKVNLVIQNKKTILLECVVKLPRKENKIAIEVCKKDLQKQISKEKKRNMTQLKIDGKEYSEKQIRNFLNDIYSNHQISNIPIWNPPSRELTFIIQAFDVFPKNVKPTDPQVIEVFNFLQELLKRYSEPANLNFIVGSEPADFALLFAPKFGYFKDLEYIKDIDLGNDFSEQDVIDREKHWAALDAKGSKTGRSFGSLWSVEQDSKKPKLHKAYYVMRTNVFKGEKFAYLVSKILCDTLLNRVGYSNEVDESCAARSRTLKPLSDHIEFNNIDKYIFSFDLALIGALYKNPEIVEMEREDAIELIINNLWLNNGQGRI